MATWTHFTSYLDGSRAITKNERDELFDNLVTILGTPLCSSAGYSLNSSELAAVKAGLWNTDRARLDGPGATVTRDRLHTLLTTAASAFSNYSAAESAALSGEGLTSTTRSDIIASGLDSYKLWNYYRRLIDALACNPPRTITSTECRTRSASKTKCGYSEYTSPSTPPKIYLQRTLAGSITQTEYDTPGGDCSGACVSQRTTDYTGFCLYTASTCSEGASGNTETLTIYSPCGVVSFTDSQIKCHLSDASLYVPAQATETLTQTQRTITGTGACLPAGAIDSVAVVGSVTETLSNEYSTVSLFSVAESALAAASWSGWGSPICAGSLYDLTSDEMTLSIREAEFRANFSGALTAGYILNWDAYDNGVYAFTDGVALSAGITSYTKAVPYFSAGAGGSRVLTNFVLTPP